MSLFRRKRTAPELPARHGHYNDADLQFIRRNHSTTPYDLRWIGSPDWARFDSHAMTRGYDIRYASWHPDKHGITQVKVTLRRQSDDALAAVDLTMLEGIGNPDRVWQHIGEEFARLDEQRRIARHAEHYNGPHDYVISADGMRAVEQQRAAEEQQPADAPRPWVNSVSVVDEHGARIPGVTLTIGDVDEDKALRVSWSGTYTGPQPVTDVVVPWNHE